MRYGVDAAMNTGLEARALGQGVWEMRWLEGLVARVSKATHVTKIYPAVTP